MRIISGSFKGKRIYEPKDNNTRPLKDLTKESIFNIIVHSNKFNAAIEESNVLDLFSGVGSFGIECLSRSAKKVVFIENYDEVLLILKKNLQNLKSNKTFEIIRRDLDDKNTLMELKDRFDIIFLDPPYKYRNINRILTNIQNQKIINKNGIIIIHRHKNSTDSLPSNFKIVESKIYGISKILFLSLN